MDAFTPVQGKIFNEKNTKSPNVRSSASEPVEGLHSFHLQSVQCKVKSPRPALFLQWFLRNDQHLVCSVLFTGEPSFTLDGVFDTNNTRIHTEPDQVPHNTAFLLMCGLTIW
ncbi:hypothetical protein CDAR_75311 [Caerostris darwini]|uniref:Uncharacterized protein n=1 Tax=Caerostris darwini TaxID=1538125 RepID=A0AAV4QR67_9ARAC|nr:hypothetical protein CDAR_75311 [Caerostris darwini]